MATFHSHHGFCVEENLELTSSSRHSGATCSRPADRDAPAATAADRRHTSAICQYGHDSTTAATAQPISAVARPDAESQRFAQPKPISVPAADATTTSGYSDDRRHGCTWAIPPS